MKKTLTPVNGKEAGTQFSTPLRGVSTLRQITFLQKNKKTICKVLNTSIGNNVVLSLLVLLLLSFFGCSGVGRVVSVDHRIPLSPKDNNQGTFSSGGLTVNYSYKMAGENMTLNGQVQYRRGFDSLNVRVLFLDASGTVLQEMIVYSSGYRVDKSSMTDLSFKETLAMPPGVTGMSFSYSAQPRRNSR